MSIALCSPSPRAAHAHALKNCLAVVGSGTVVSMRLPALAPDAFVEKQSRAASGS
jgi:hypothetical protein